MEQWRFVVGYEGLYEVSSYGRVRSVRIGKCISARADSKGYPRVYLSKRNKEAQYSVHRLVAIAFIDNPENKPQVNHKNGFKTDNHIDNLEWATPQENNLHARETGLSRKAYPQKRVASLHSNEIKVYQFDDTGNFIGAISSISIAAASVNTGPTTIWKAIDKPRLAKGYYWKSYIDEHLHSIERMWGY